MVAEEKKLEFDLLGLTFGLDFKEPALKLPLVGQIAVSNR